MAAFCTQCGEPVTGAQRFCTGCGSPLPVDAPAEPTKASPSAVPPPDRARRRSVIIVAVVLLVAAIGTGVAFAVSGGSSPNPDPPPSPVPTTTAPPTPPTTSSPAPTPPPTTVTPTTSAAQQAASIDALLSDSVAARTEVTEARKSITACDIDPASVANQVQLLTDAITARQTLLTRLASTPMDQLPSADSLRTNLEAAWSASIDADRYYLAWAQSNAGCKGGGDDPNEQAGDDVSNTRSQPAKKAFLAAWNPIATTYGLDGTRTTTDI